MFLSENTELSQYLGQMVRGDFEVAGNRTGTRRRKIVTKQIVSLSITPLGLY